MRYVFEGSNPYPIIEDSVSGGSGSYSYQWSSSTDGNTWSNISGANTWSYTPPSNSQPVTIYYRVGVTSGGQTVISNSCKVQFVAHVKPGSITTLSKIVDSGMDGGTLSTTPATGGACGGSYSYLSNYTKFYFIDRSGGMC